MLVNYRRTLLHTLSYYRLVGRWCFKFVPQNNNCSILSLRKIHFSPFDLCEHDQIGDLDLSWLRDQQYTDHFLSDYLLPYGGHNVFILQPDFKWGKRKNVVSSVQSLMDESHALIESIPKWKVQASVRYSLKHEDRGRLFGKGNFESITDNIHRYKNITAVFVNISLLSSSQLSTMQTAWNLPVYDRYTIVLQIFQSRAKTNEAKLQVALAEIPFLRSRLYGMQSGRLTAQMSNLDKLGGMGETYLETRKRILQEREIRIKNALQKIQDKRQVMKKSRARGEIPVVAVVGYTNAGKTSLIKVLTQSEKMMPKNQLFATLDVTVHPGFLCNNMKVLFIDTVGFISDIPTELISAFSATLKDMLDADLIIHVYDTSNVNVKAQMLNVNETLKRMNLPQKLEDSIIEVGNKIDLVSSSVDGDNLHISTVTGEGLNALSTVIEKALLINTDRLLKKFKVPMSGTMLQWLRKESSIESIEPCPDDAECVFVKVIMTQKQFSLFKKLYSKKG